MTELNCIKTILVLFLSTISLLPSAQVVPNFTMTDTDGQDWNLYEELQNGKTVLIDFFYVACKPCQTFTPMVEQVHQDYKNSSNLIVLGISDRDSNSQIELFESQYGASYPSCGIEGGGDTVTTLFQLWFPFIGWPTYAVICSNKNIAWNVQKSSGLNEIRDSIDLCQSISLSIEDRDFAKSNLEVYPIPTNGLIHIKTGLLKPSSISVLNIYGSEMLTQQLSPNASVSILDLNHLFPGLYYIKLFDAKSNRTKTIKIIKI